MKFIKLIDNLKFKKFLILFFIISANFSKLSEQTITSILKHKYYYDFITNNNSNDLFILKTNKLIKEIRKLNGIRCYIFLFKKFSKSKEDSIIEIRNRLNNEL